MVFVLAGIGAVAVSCDRATPTALEPVSTPRLATGGAVLAAATGAGTVDLSTAGVPNLTFNLNALGYGDGKGSGTFRQRRETVGGVVDFTAEVICLTIDKVNRRAWVGGLVTKNNSTDPAFMTTIHEVGDHVWFRMVDYKRKDSDPVDRSTTLGFEGAAGFLTSPAYCAGKPWPAADARTFPVLKGDISVRW